MRTTEFRKEEFSEKEKRTIDILEILRRYGPISRPEISKEMGVNVVTISNYIDDFIKHNLVYEKELDVSEGGRRPTLLDLNPRAAYTIGVGLNLMNMVGLLTDLKGNIITKTQIARPKSLSVRQVTECTMDIVREVVKRSKEYLPNLKGVGIGVAGLVNKKTGAIHWPQKVDQYYTYATVDLQLRELIEKEFNLPVLIENDATAACFGEHWLDLERGYKNVIYMFSGVGCGIMINGDIFTGSQGYAGETAVYNFKEQDTFHCPAAKSCFIKRWEMDLGIVEEVKTKLSQDKTAALEFKRITSTDITEADLKTIFTAAHAKEPVSFAALQDAGYRLGVKISQLVNLLNPQVVVIGGGFEEAGDDFLNKVTATVRDWSFHETTEDLKITYSQLRENAVAIGAASLVMQNLFARIG